MATHRYDPYLWVHLAGIATVPLWLAICGLGLAVGAPRWPGLELALLGLAGVLPILWMQLWRPFYIFSLLTLKLKPTALSDDQRRLLSLFRQGWVRSLAVVVPVPLVWLLWEIYPRAVVASDITPFAPWGRLGGLAVAIGSFAMANLFLQVPVSVLAVMATADKRFKRTQPYPLDQIQAHFTQAGIPLGGILPSVRPPDAAVSSVASQEAADLDPEVAMDDAPVWADALRAQTELPLAVAAAETKTAVGSAVTESITASVTERATAGEATAQSVVDGVTASQSPTVEAAVEMAAVPLEAVADLDPVDSPGDPSRDLEAVEIVAEDSGSHSPSRGDWDQGEANWDQTAHGWDQDVAWEASVDAATKDHTIEVAVVRISDPS